MEKTKNLFISRFFYIFLAILFLFKGYGQHEESDSVYYPKEEDYYQIQTLEIPQDIILEVGGLTLLPNGKLAVCTRRGEVWVVSNPYRKYGEKPHYSLFAQGLHEPLGLSYHDGDIFVAQRQELTRLRDVDSDGRADEYKTVQAFHLTGNYHEYAYGPVFDKEGNMFVTLNLGWIGGEMLSKVKWRGWMMKITPEGVLIPFAAGMRSPAGLAIDDSGSIYYTDNQGGWIGSGWLNVLEKGDFVGHPASLAWSGEENSPIALKQEDIPNTGEPMYKVAKDIEGLKSPAVWLPHAVIGVSTSDILTDPGSNFGPFDGQIFIGDQGQSMINRVFLEEINGVKQGVVFPFRSGFSSGVMRMDWGRDSSIFVGMTARGWGSTGGELYGLQRLVWNGEVPFEMKSVQIRPDGFEITFTKPVELSSARDVRSYNIRSFTYKYHKKYGSPVINSNPTGIKAIEVSKDQKRVRLVLDSIRLGYIHEISLPGVISLQNSALLHSVGYYTVNQIPTGDELVLTESNKVQAPIQKTEKSPGFTVGVGKSMSDVSSEDNSKDIDLLLAKYTCQSCHHLSDKRVGPSFSEISKKRYSIEEMIELIQSPKPGNWPEFATPMPPMSHVPEEDLERIAKWIRGLDK
ncbi:DUF7133 domain-containing protein [Membranihabitans maritimus]|uniref:DUF7133 domain-containing protein n=1 Tax=Membranihabitans maritimus TaxID=2904244 RepID=UPI001F34DA43|nr:hypothetical protein [Membranihabitans maritimus]